MSPDRTPHLSEERIAALIDGAIEDPVEAEALRRAIEADPRAQALAMRVGRMNELVREAFSAPIDEPVPDAIAAAILGSGGPGVAARGPLGRDATARRGGRSGRGMAGAWRPARAGALAWAPRLAAAGLVLGIGIGAGIWLAGDERPTVVAVGDVSPGGALHRVLETAPSGTELDGITPLLSFRDGAGRPCREFEARQAAATGHGIACREVEGRWRVEAVAMLEAVATPPGQSGYVPASGGADDGAIEAALDAIDAGPALGPAEEAGLIASGWRGAE